MNIRTACAPIVAIEISGKHCNVTSVKVPTPLPLKTCIIGALFEWVKHRGRISLVRIKGPNWFLLKQVHVPVVWYPIAAISSRLRFHFRIRALLKPYSCVGRPPLGQNCPTSVAFQTGTIQDFKYTETEREKLNALDSAARRKRESDLSDCVTRETRFLCKLHNLIKNCLRFGSSFGSMEQFVFY